MNKHREETYCGASLLFGGLLAAVTIFVFAFPVKAGEEPDGHGTIVYKPMVPRWQLPPIANPYFIGWYGAHTPGRPGFETALFLQTQTMETDVPAEDLTWWYGRGIMGCPWAAGTQVGWLNTTDDFVDQFNKAIKARATNRTRLGSRIRENSGFWVTLRSLTTSATGQLDATVIRHSRAYTFPSSLPTYKTPSTTHGEDATGPPVLNFHASLPVADSTAYTWPSSQPK